MSIPTRIPTNRLAPKRRENVKKREGNVTGPHGGMGRSSRGNTGF